MNGSSGLILLLLLAALPYFMIIRPQRRAKQRQNQLQGALSEGDEIVTRGGIYGVVRSVDDDTIDVEIATDVIVRFHRQAVAQILVDRDAPVEHDPDDEPTDADVAESAG